MTCFTYHGEFRIIWIAQKVSLVRFSKNWFTGLLNSSLCSECMLASKFFYFRKLASSDTLPYLRKLTSSKTLPLAPKVTQLQNPSPCSESYLTPKHITSSESCLAPKLCPDFRLGAQDFVRAPDSRNANGCTGTAKNEPAKTSKSTCMYDGSKEPQ